MSYLIDGPDPKAPSLRERLGNPQPAIRLGGSPAAAELPSERRASTELRDWVFTFGSGHRAYAAHDRFSPDPKPGRGFRLDDRYVVIRGTYDSARQRMVEIFGPVWCCQYGSPESAGVDQYRLTELVITDA